MKEVGEKRFEEVTAERERQAVLRSGVAMRLRMILERKRDGRRKGRLVGQGFLEPELMTRGKEDSPVASGMPIKALFFGAAGCIDDDIIGTIDVSTAFLQAKAYSGEAVNRYATFREYKGGPLRVYRLLGPLYGQRDAPRRWFETIKEGLEGIGFVPAPTDPCALYNPMTGVRIALVVDDCLVRGKKEEVEKVMHAIGDPVEGMFACTEPKYLTIDNPIDFVGFRLSMTQEEDGVGYWMDQEGDVEQFMIDHGIDINLEVPVECPMPNKGAMFRDETVLAGDEKTTCRSIIGGLSWFATSLRWDIQHATSRLQMKSHNPTVSCMSEAMRVIAYVYHTKGFKLGGVRTQENTFAYYSDSDFAGDREMAKASRSGVVLMLNGVPVHWVSKPQPKTVYSPAAAEIYALREATREGQALTWTCRDLGFTGITLPFLVQVDNQQAISFQQDTCVRTKHKGVIDMAESWVVELKSGRLVYTEYIATDRNPADIFTKCLDRQTFQERRKLFGQRYIG